MKRLFHFLIYIIPDFIFAFLLLMLFHVKYVSSFEHCREVGQRLRIPLWKPYEIVDFRDSWSSCSPPRGVELHDWNMWWISGTYNERVYEEDTDPEQEALKYLTEIKNFALGDGVVCGLRRVLPSRDGRNYHDRYFLFASNHTEVAYFMDLDVFLRECRKYGIDGTVLQDFSGNWRSFWEKDGSDAWLIKEIIEDFREGFTGRELTCLVFLSLSYAMLVARRICPALWIGRSCNET